MTEPLESISTPIIDARVRLPRPRQSVSELPREYLEQYDRVLGLSEKSAATLSDLDAAMRRAGVDHAIVHAEYETGDPADQYNEEVAKIVASNSRRFSGFGTISLHPLDIQRAVRQVDRVAELGLHGVTFQPSFADMPIDDRRLYPVYSRAESLRLPVAVHTGINYTRHMPISNDHPLQLDRVACDFPALVLIASHAGWPWVADMVAVMRKHPTVYAEFGGLAPKYVMQSGSGWEIMHRFMNSLVSEQILFASDWPVIPIEDSVAQWKAGDLKPEVVARLLGVNARRLLGMEVPK
ncbi:amidohydrolase family protein [Microbacterium sp. AGC85]